MGKSNKKLRRFLNWLAAMIIFGLLPMSGCVQPAHQATAPATNPATNPVTIPMTNAPARARHPENEPANPKLPSLFLIGDSTVRNGQGDGGGGLWGWGEPIVAFFDQTKINVVNRAVGGLSSRTYLTGGHWERVMAMLKPGDFVIMQLGTNDGGPLNDNSRARGTIKGSGDESQEIENLLTKQHEVVHTYGWYLRKFITDAKSKSATPIVCSLIPRKTWKDGKIARASDSYGKWAAEAAKAESVAFVDLNEIIARKYDELGPEKIDPFYGDPHTHTSLAGAELNAACVISGLKGLKENPLATCFSEKARGIAPADLSKPAPAPAKSNGAPTATTKTPTDE